MESTKLTSIDSKKGKWSLILITGLFAFIFTNIFEPFGIYNSQNKSGFEIFLEINIALLGAIGTLALSQFVIRKALRIDHFTYFTIVFWFVFESFLIGGVWTLLTVLIDGDVASVFSLWLTNIIECVFLIGLPYFSTLVYLSFREKAETVDYLQKEINKEKVNPNIVVSFKDNSDKEKLNLRLGDVLYVESSDNYVVIHYRFNQRIEKELLRNTIKNMETELQPYAIIRCHRSYMVNPINIIKKEKTPKGFNLFIKYDEQAIIPVSRSYSSELEKILK